MDLDPEQKMQFLFALRSKGVTDSRVLTAMERIDRGPFVSGVFSARAYEDMPLPIACGQTISQPSVVGLMTPKFLPPLESTNLPLMKSLAWICSNLSLYFMYLKYN